MEGETFAASFPTGALRKSSSSETRNSFHARSRSSVETRNPLSIKKVTVACHTGPRSRILPCCESPISHRNSFSPFDTRAFAEGAATAAGPGLSRAPDAGVAFIRVLATQLIAVLFVLAARGHNLCFAGVRGALSARTALRTAGPYHFHFPSQTRSIFNRKSRCQHASLHFAVRSQLDPLPRLQVPLHRAFNDDLACFDVRLYPPIGSHGHAGVRQAYLPLRFAVNVQIRVPRNFAVDLQTYRYRRQTIGSIGLRTVVRGWRRRRSRRARRTCLQRGHFWSWYYRNCRHRSLRRRL